MSCILNIHFNGRIDQVIQIMELTRRHRERPGKACDQGEGPGMACDQDEQPDKAYDQREGPDKACDLGGSGKACDQGERPDKACDLGGSGKACDHLRIAIDIRVHRY